MRGINVTMGAGALALYLGLVPVWAAADGWVLHRSPLGFEISHPGGWRVDTSTQDLIVVRGGGAWVAIHPFLLRQPVTAEQWLRQAPAKLPGLLGRGRLLRAQQRTRAPVDEALAALEVTVDGQPARSSAICSIYRNHGMFYAIAAADPSFASLRPQLVRVLQSFRATGVRRQGGGATPARAVDFVRWRDPRENAFSVDVPRGWRAEGGMFRFASVDTRAALDLRSPDGAVHVVAGDSNIPPHTIPTPTLTMTGFREGSWYSPGYGVRMLVRRFLPGGQFALEYARSKLAAGCGEVRITQSRELPEASRELSRLYASYTGVATMQVSAGEVAFTCGGERGPMSGYMFAGTLLTQMQGGGGLWHVPFLHGFLAAPQAVPVADTVIRRLLSSVQINPQWAGMQQQVTAQTSRIVSETSSYVSRVISESYWSRQKVMDNLSRKWSNVILGQTDVVDPATGETWKVASGHNYYWRQDYTDNIAGTNTYDRPDINFSPLLEY